MKPSRRRGATVAAISVTALVVGTVAVSAALTSSGAEQFSQGASGQAGMLETGDYFAGAVAVGDFDGDGYGDVIAGAAFENFGSKTDVGLVHVLYGTRSGLSTSNDTTLHLGSTGVPGKAKRGDMFGSSVAVGDFDDDGYDDAVVGIPGRDTRTRSNAGGFTILYGSSRGLRGKDAQTYTASTKGVAGPAEAHANLGTSVASGDFDGDGYDDIAVGAPGSGSGSVQGAGAVHVLFGTKKGISKAGDQRLHQGQAAVAGDREADDAFGSSLATGDFDNDRDDDLAVGIPGKAVEGAIAAGAVQIFDGSGSGLDPLSGRVVTQASGDLANSPESDDLFGASLAAGNFDGNNHDDLAIGSPGEASGSKLASGRVHVVYGSSNGLKTSGSDSYTQATKRVKGSPRAGDEFGWSLVAADFNNNDRVDLAIGVPGEPIGPENGAGLVHVLYGGSKGLKTRSHEWFWPGHKGIPGTPVANGGFSRALGAGDVNGDGRADLVVGAPGQKLSGKPSAGMLIVIFG